MPFAGKQLQGSEIAAQLHALGFRDLDLVEMTATILGESQGFVQAYNDNLQVGARLKRGDRVALEEYGVGKVVRMFGRNVVDVDVGAQIISFPQKNVVKIASRDVGLAQINIPARDIGTIRERKLYDPATNLRAAKKLFDTRETLSRRRRFNPWYAFTTGWATFPEWWVFRSAKAAASSGKPREWVPTGRYLHQAITGVANFYADSYGISPRPLLHLPAAPAQPGKPPVGDGSRPIANQGRGSLG